MTTTFDDATTAAIAAFAQLDFYTAVQAMRAEADYDRERDEWISRYIDEHGGGADDAEYDALHAQAQATPEYAAFIDAMRREILDYFGVTDESTVDDPLDRWHDDDIRRRDHGSDRGFCATGFLHGRAGDARRG
ncbi:ATP-dependent protease, partial [Burkholderia multivorans]|nr:ATP-dependent protease [Burkholderia multivorans]